MKVKPGIFVIDVETTANTDPDKAFPAWPFDVNNRIVMLGYIYKGTTSKNTKGVVTTPEALKAVVKDRKEETQELIDSLIEVNEPVILVGANIKFDLAYLLRAETPHIWKKLLENPHIHLWDVCVVEHVLSAQHDKFPSLDSLSVRYGGTQKDKAVTELFDNGHGADAVHPDDLKLYLLNDLENTHLVFEAQFEKVKKADLTNIIKLESWALKATLLMELSGMHVCLENLENVRKLMEEVHLDSKRNYIRYLHSHLLKLGVEIPEDCDINYESNAQLSRLIYGGKLTVTRPVLKKYKNGNEKTVKKDYTISVPYNRYLSKIVSKYVTNPDDYVPLNEAAIAEIITELPNSDLRNAVLCVSKCRVARKYLTTYIGNLLKKSTIKDIKNRALPSDRNVSIIHNNYHHTATQTGRITSSIHNFPRNEQNIDDVSLKSVFVPQPSLYGGWNLFELDLSQIEIVGLAQLSKDDALVDDINHGVDIHAAIGKAVFGGSAYNDKIHRHIIKRANFAMIYGAGIQKLCDITGQSHSLMLKVQKEFRRRYPKAFLMSDRIYEKCVRSHRHEMMFRLETGRFLKFILKEGHKPGLREFYLPDMRNWPIQTWAGDISKMLFRAILEHQLLSRTDANIVHTVYDSVLFEVFKPKEYSFIEGIKKVLKSLPALYREYSKDDELLVPIRATLKKGSDWGTMCAVKLE